MSTHARTNASPHRARVKRSSLYVCLEVEVNPGADSCSLSNGGPWSHRRPSASTVVNLLLILGNKVSLSQSNLIHVLNALSTI